jgi:AmmeMemoRadiSam system protein B/AmmeMemoRadiSam system protein A
MYSGTVAASAYRHLQASNPERVFMMGFTHRGAGPGVLIPDVGGIQTPLGVVSIDQVEAAALVADGPFVRTAESRVCDHSVEIQLPLLQTAVPGARVLPLYVGHLNDAQRYSAARILARHIGPGDVLLASSDLTHYGRSFGYEPFPAGADLAERLSRLDHDVIDAAGSLDPTCFLETLRELESTVCGYEPISLMLETLNQLGCDDVFQQTLDYQTSAEITGEVDHSVSYASLGYFRAGSFFLDAAGCEALLSSARATLRHLSATRRRGTAPPANAGPSLWRRASAFVSLHLGEDLFGCVGRRTQDVPLAELIPELTLAAALDDPRFPNRDNVTEGLDVEISLLTPLKRIPDWRSFCVGRDGAYLESGERSAMLLPQVARHGANTETRFMEALSRKAGLRPDAYRDPKARLSVFQAQVFGGPAGVA